MKIEFNKLRLEKTVVKETAGEIASSTLTLSQNNDLKARFTILLKGKLAKELSGQNQGGILNKNIKITIEVVD